ncbi:hypothetical protein M970_090440 [Encephalitozoon cuniculi EcunIII-L]|uniref:Uncharacterized protein n=1 Tax=Encephalitozoon cuniculi TaxID=6035 RepID=M1KLN9_ENCCN|nr:hypothetical protein ECU09_0420 [Encephalitozoon cuniculi]KMV65522.1 hypothetical protein M970_090440 [Encephalitozoon cuniculi EcunIII-L]UYI26721.1 armadillo repeat domain-containing protein [Encephalitozoon cuniculi]
MESLIRKLNKWHELKKEHLLLLHERRQREVERAVGEAKKTRNIKALLRILATDADKCKGLKEFLDEEFKRSISFNSKERISMIVECMRILGLECENYRLMLIDHLENVCSRVSKACVAARIKSLGELREYDMTNGLKIHEYIERRIDGEIDRYMERIPVGNPRELDGWLNEMVDVCKYRPKVVETYGDLEIKYFSMCLGIVMLNDRVSAVEDVVYLVNKIHRRSSAVGVCIDNEMMGKLKEYGMLEEGEIKALFQK